MTVNYELSVKLKNLGVCQVSEKYWVKRDNSINLIYRDPFGVGLDQPPSGEIVSAFSMGELMRLLGGGFQNIELNGCHLENIENDIALNIIQKIPIYQISEMNQNYLKLIRK